MESISLKNPNLIEDAEEENLKPYPWKELKKFVPKNGRIAELYCGSSLPTLPGLAKIVGTKGHIYAVDAEDFPIGLDYKSTRRTSARVSETPIKTDELDTLIFAKLGWMYALSLMNPIEKQEFAAEAVRILKPQGYLIICDSKYPINSENGFTLTDEHVQTFLPQPFKRLKILELDDKNQLTIYQKC